MFYHHNIIITHKLSPAVPPPHPTFCHLVARSQKLRNHPWFIYIVLMSVSPEVVVEVVEVVDIVEVVEVVVEVVV